MLLLVYNNKTKTNSISGYHSWDSSYSIYIKPRFEILFYDSVSINCSILNNINSPTIFPKHHLFLVSSSGSVVVSISSINSNSSTRLLGLQLGLGSRLLLIYFDYSICGRALCKLQRQSGRKVEVKSAQDQTLPRSKKIPRFMVIRCT
jgi:hypothetical protein